MTKIPLQQTPRLPQRILLAVLMVLVSSCATTPSVITPSAESGRLWQQRMLELTDLKSWVFKGRIAIKSTSDSMSAGIQWTQQKEHSDINFSNLFGQRIARLQIDPDKTILHMRDHQVLAALDASSLLQEHFGWTIPVDGLRYWVLGLPGPDNGKYTMLDEGGRLQWLEQSGWHIEYSRYAESGGFDLPEKIELSRDDLRVRLVIDLWEAETSPGFSGNANTQLSMQ